MNQIAWMALVWMVFVCPAYAAEPGTTSGGLIWNPPAVLKARFPMCDVYLKVDWIDKEKRIGHTHYDAQMLDDKGVLEKKKKSAWALVNLEDSAPSYTLDIYSYKQQNRMGELFDLVRNGKPSKVPAHFAIEYKGKTVVFYDSYDPVFANHEKTVCIAYPDEKRVWIIEVPNVKTKYSEEQIGALHKQLNFPDVPRARKALENLWALDFNFDGLDDYISDIHFGNRGLVAFSSPDGLRRPVRGEIDFGHTLTSPVNGRVCQFLHDGNGFPLTTDGQTYFFSHCNLTQLTSPTPKE